MCGGNKNHLHLLFLELRLKFTRGPSSSLRGDKYNRCRLYASRDDPGWGLEKEVLKVVPKVPRLVLGDKIPSQSGRLHSSHYESRSTHFSALLGHHVGSGQDIRDGLLLDVMVRGYNS